MKHRIISTLCAGIVFLGLVSTAEAALLGRLPVTPGGFDFQAIYDTDRDITWLQDANLAASNQFGLPQVIFETPDPGEIGSTGKMKWDTANSWIIGMNAAMHLGFDDWRLPTIRVPDLSCAPGTVLPIAFGCQGSELGHLFYIELLNPIGGPLRNKGGFSNVQDSIYWSSGSGFSTDSVQWIFDFNGSSQGGTSREANHFVWAVRSGDVSAPAVPAPSAMLLFGTGLVGLAGWRHWRIKSVSSWR